MVIILLLWVYSLRLSGHQVLSVSFHGNQTNESLNKFKQFSSSVWEASLGFPARSLLTQWDWKIKMGRENGGWIVAHCPVLLSLNLWASSFAVSSTFLLSHTPVFPLFIYHSYSISSFLSQIHLFVHPPLHHFSVTFPLPSTSTTLTTFSACNSGKACNCQLEGICAAALIHYLVAFVIPVFCDCFHFSATAFPLLYPASQPCCPHVSQTCPAHTNTEHTTPFSFYHWPLTSPLLFCSYWHRAS